MRARLATTGGHARKPCFRYAAVACHYAVHPEHFEVEQVVIFPRLQARPTKGASRGPIPAAPVAAAAAAAADPAAAAAAAAAAPAVLLLPSCCCL